jgi:hypothetical protein
MMKISIIIIHIILCLMMLITGCSRTNNQVSTLWEERQMDDDRRLYGNPYDSLNRQKYIFSFIPLIESCFIISSHDPWQESLRIKSTPSDYATTIQGGIITESQSFLNSMIFALASSSDSSSAMAMK